VLRIGVWRRIEDSGCESGGLACRRNTTFLDDEIP
jgi:hypothetical protein